MMSSGGGSGLLSPGNMSMSSNANPFDDDIFGMGSGGGLGGAVGGSFGSGSSGAPTLTSYSQGNLVNNPHSYGGGRMTPTSGMMGGTTNTNPFDDGF